MAFGNLLVALNDGLHIMFNIFLKLFVVFKMLFPYLFHIHELQIQWSLWNSILVALAFNFTFEFSS